MAYLFLEYVVELIKFIVPTEHKPAFGGRHNHHLVYLRARQPLSGMVSEETENNTSTENVQHFYCAIMTAESSLCCPPWDLLTDDLIFFKKWRQFWDISFLGFCNLSFLCLFLAVKNDLAADTSMPLFIVTQVHSP